MSTSGNSYNVGGGPPQTETDVGAFTTKLLDINPTYLQFGPGSYPVVWTQFVVTLPTMAPVNGRLAFRYFVENGGAGRQLGLHRHRHGAVRLQRGTGDADTNPGGDTNANADANTNADANVDTGADPNPGRFVCSGNHGVHEPDGHGGQFRPRCNGDSRLISSFPPTATGERSTWGRSRAGTPTT